MTSTDTLLPCPFCGEDLIPDATPDGLAEHPSSDCPAGDWLVRPADWNRRTPPTPATDEREAVARALCIAGEEDDFNYKGYLELADAALSTLAQIRAAEILAAEARGYAMAVEDAANEARDLWEYGIPSQEFPRRIRAIEHGAGK